MLNVQPSNHGYCQTQSRFIQVVDMGSWDRTHQVLRTQKAAQVGAPVTTTLGMEKHFFQLQTLPNISTQQKGDLASLHHILPGLICSATKVETALPPLMANRVYCRQIAA